METESSENCNHGNEDRGWCHLQLTENSSLARLMNEIREIMMGCWCESQPVYCPVIMVKRTLARLGVPEKV